MFSFIKPSTEAGLLDRMAFSSFCGHMKNTSGSIIDLKYTVYTRIRSGKGLMMLTWILLFNYFGWNIATCIKTYILQVGC